MTLELWIGLCGLALHAIGMLVAGVWAISKIKQEVMAALAQHRGDVHNMIDTERRAIQDSFQALRQKISDNELEAYKVFVRRDSFHEIINRLSEQNSDFRKAMHDRLDRQEAKIDKLVDRLTVPAHQQKFDRG